MSHIQFVRRAGSVVIAAACSLFSLVLFAPSAFARVMPPPGGSGSGLSPQSNPTVVHNVVTGGMAGWQIALIAVAVLTATFAVLADRLRQSHRKVRLAAA
jgi:hypothetical protein